MIQETLDFHGSYLIQACPRVLDNSDSKNIDLIAKYSHGKTIFIHAYEDEYYMRLFSIF